MNNKEREQRVRDFNERLRTARADAERRGETFYPGASGVALAAYPPKERWDDWVEMDSRAWPRRKEKRYMLVPTTCFNCESACGLLAYVDKDTLTVRKFEGNPEHPGSRGRNCAKGPATINQVTDPDRVLFPLKRAGERGEGKWVRTTWDEALDDIAARIRKAIVENRHNAVMYHVGRPGEDGYTERVLAAWGVDGHNSHTNICSSSGRVGYAFWMGLDRPSADHANADVIFLISAHLESGHYFNPHAQRIVEGKHAGAKVIVLDVRLSNTATHADHWLAPRPGSEAAILLAIANEMIRTGAYDRDFVRRWWNWEEYLDQETPGGEPRFETFEARLRELYANYTFEYAAAESGVDEGVLREVAAIVAGAGTRLSSHVWRSAAAGNLGGWQVSRCLFLLNALTGAVATEGGVFPNAWNKFVPKPIYSPPHPKTWNELTWPVEYPLAMHEMSILLPHLLEEGRGALDVYFSRVYNPVWTNPNGFAWIEALSDPAKVGLHAALTPTWNESAYFADYVLPMGLASERHDVHSYETHDAQWIGFRQTVLRAARERNGETIGDSREANPGEVWEENEFWIELSWRVDPDGALGIRQYFESKDEPGAEARRRRVLPLHVRALGAGLAGARQGGEPRAARLHAPLRRVRSAQEDRCPPRGAGARGRTRRRRRRPLRPRLRAQRTAADAQRRAAAVAAAGCRRPPAGRRAIDGRIVRGFPTPSGKLEFWSRTLADWGWPEYALPGYVKSHVHPDNMEPGQMVLVPTFRLPTQIHTRGGNAKWLDELANTNPVWIHPSDAARLGDLRTGDLVRITTETGHFVVKAWVTEGIRSRRRRVQPSHGALASRRQRPEADHGEGRARPRRRRVGDAPHGRRQAVSRRPIRTRSASGGATSACTRT